MRPTPSQPNHNKRSAAYTDIFGAGPSGRPLSEHHHPHQPFQQHHQQQHQHYPYNYNYHQQQQPQQQQAGLPPSLFGEFTLPPLSVRPTTNSSHEQQQQWYYTHSPHQPLHHHLQHPHQSQLTPHQALLRTQSFVHHPSPSPSISLQEDHYQQQNSTRAHSFTGTANPHYLPPNLNRRLSTENYQHPSLGPPSASSSSSASFPTNRSSERIIPEHIAIEYHHQPQSQPQIYNHQSPYHHQLLKTLEPVDGFPNLGLSPIREASYRNFDQPGPVSDFNPSDRIRRPSVESDRSHLVYSRATPLPVDYPRPQAFSNPVPPQPPSNPTIQPRRSSESVRVMPTQPKQTSSSAYDRSFSFTAATATTPHPQPNRPRQMAAPNQTPLRPPIVYPALLSKVAEAFKMRIQPGERTKDGLSYTDCFDGREAVDKIAYIIKTTDRNLALLLGRALDAQKFFHDVTYDHRLRDSPHELYQFQGRLTRTSFSDERQVTKPIRASEEEEEDEEGADPAEHEHEDDDEEEIVLPSGVFTLLTDCYSPTCTRDRLCYSIACPRRLEQQARLNLKPKPGLLRRISTESLNDLKEPGTLWIHSVPQEVVDSVSDQEKKRQEAINECIYTERDFVRDLEYLRDVWIKPLQTTNIIPESRRQDFVTQVFWNVLEILAVNGRLCELLSKRQKSSDVVYQIADIYLECVPHFGPFVKYGAHQLYGKYEFEREKTSNPSFSKFVDETERLPESRKLELNAYLTKPTTRLARYPLLLEVVLKYTPDDHPDKLEIVKVVKMIRELLTKVNIETGKSENRFNLAQLDQQLVFRPGEAVDLRLREEGRELIFKGQLKKRGGGGSDSAELQLYLFDHALLMVKHKHSSKNPQLKVYRKPIPLELLTVTGVMNQDDHQSPAGNQRNSAGGSSAIGGGGSNGSNGGRKSIMTRTSGSGKGTTPTSGSPSGMTIVSSTASAALTSHLQSGSSNKTGYPMTFNHLGRKGYSIVLWAPTFQSRQKWLEKIEARQAEIRERNTVFEMICLNEGFFVGTNKVTCAAPFDNGTRLVFGTDSGVYLANAAGPNGGSTPVRVIQTVNVTQVDVIEEQGILIVLADRVVMTFWISNLDPSDAIGAAKRARKISSHASFFKVGDCLGRKLVCVVKSGSVSSTIKTLEPLDVHRNQFGRNSFVGGALGVANGGRHRSSFTKKIIPANNDALKVYKEFYIPTESSSVHFLKSKLCVGCNKGFEIVDLESLDTQGLIDPADVSLEFITKRENVKPVGIYRIEGEFLLCYEDFAFYVNKNGWRAKSGWIIQWEGHPTAFALHYPFVLAFEPSFIEVRHVETGGLVQIIPGPNIRHLFSESPPSTSAPVLAAAAAASSSNQKQNLNGNLVRNPMASLVRSQIVFAAESRILQLRLKNLGGYSSIVGGVSRR